MTPVDWQALRTAATAAAASAYAPYSRLHVGAAGLVDDGRARVIRRRETHADIWRLEKR